MVGHDQQRGNQEWHSPQVGGFDPRFMRPVPPLSFPFPFPPPYHPFPPQQAFPFGSPLAYPEMAPHFFPTLPLDIQAGGPFPVQPPPDVYSPLHFEILRQIEYYFSKDNLIKDLHFRKEWNGQGWVHISIIAAFKKVSSMTRDINLILDAIRTSTMLEIQGEMVRKRDDWERWLVPKDFKFSSDTSPPIQ
ncbi:HTH La-type RNA-binding domain-containing protein [Psidium guajava]|nr:HTH La-type RNA-binding domain-containing protein [Psidium guajava]